MNRKTAENVALLVVGIPAIIWASSGLLRLAMSLIIVVYTEG